MKIKKESKYTSPIKHILINDEGIGSNRIIISNNYLNNYNYFNKNNIKMMNIHKRKYLENKYKKEEYKKGISIPQLVWSTSYYIDYNKTNNNYNNELKKTELNYFEDINKNGSYIKFNTRKNCIKKTFRIYEDLINKIKDDSKNKKIKEETNKELNNINNYNSTDTKDKNKKIKKKILFDDDFFFLLRRKNRFSDIKCNVIFGKTLSTDYGLRLKQNKKINKKNYSNNKSNSINNNKKYFKNKYDNSNFSNNNIISNINAYADEPNKYNSLSKSYGYPNFEKKEQKILIEDNTIDKVLPLINNKFK